MISKQRFMYRQLGWPGLLPRFWAVYGLMLKDVRREEGLMTALFMFYDLAFKLRTDMAKEFRRRLLRDLLLIGFAVWAFILAKPWLAMIWAAATDGIALQWPRLPFTLPPVLLSDLPGAFLHYGWLLPVLAFVIYRGWTGVAKAVACGMILSFFVVSVVWVYAALFGDTWSAATTTHDYFSFGYSLPLVMRMQTFMQDWGLLLAIWLIHGIVDFLATAGSAKQQKLDEAQKPSGALPDCREATTADLRKGGLL